MGTLAGFFVDDVNKYLDLYADSVKKRSAYNPHITLFYFSEEDIDLGVIKSIFDIETRRLKKTGNCDFDANVTGIARFRMDSGSTDPVVALVDCPAVHTYRQNLMKRFDDSGIYYEKLFTPHITIGYVSKNYDAKIPKIKKYEFEISKLTLCNSVDSYSYEV